MSTAVGGDNPSMSRALTEAVASGGYVVDTEAVAVAMLSHVRIRQVASGVLVPAEPADRAAVCLPEDDSAAFGDAA